MARPTLARVRANDRARSRPNVVRPREAVTRSTAERGASYATTVERFKDLPDGERIERLESLVATLAPELNGDTGPFRLLSWDEAHGLARDGNVTLYPHTVTHPILSRCPDEKVAYEIFESCATIERETGVPPTVFAYPNGRAQDFDERAKTALRRQGVQWALATTTGLAHRDSDPLALPRIPVGCNLSFAGFQLLLSGAVARRRVISIAASKAFDIGVRPRQRRSPKRRAPSRSLPRLGQC